MTDFAFHAAARIAQQCIELFFKTIFLIRLPDEVQYRQAFFPLSEPQSAAKLLQENRQRLGWAQEKNRIDFRNIHAFIIEIYNENEADTAFCQSPPYFTALVIR